MILLSELDESMPGNLVAAVFADALSEGRALLGAARIGPYYSASHGPELVIQATTPIIWQKRNGGNRMLRASGARSSNWRVALTTESTMSPDSVRLSPGA